jgi:hypothetical protein
MQPRACNECRRRGVCSRRVVAIPSPTCNRTHKPVVSGSYAKEAPSGGFSRMVVTHGMHKHVPVACMYAPSGQCPLYPSSLAIPSSTSSGREAAAAVVVRSPPHSTWWHTGCCCGTCRAPPSQLTSASTTFLSRPGCAPPSAGDRVESEAGPHTKPH